MNRRRLLAKTAGSWRASQSSFGPTAWVVRGEPPLARIDSAPKRSVNSTISASARVSTP